MADGEGCLCHAKCRAECGCENVDWTPKEVYELKKKNNKLTKTIGWLCNIVLKTNKRK